MVLRVSVERPADPTWRTCLRGIRSDVYHQPGYHAFEESLGHGDAYLVFVEDGRRRLAWPYLLRSVDPTVDGGSGHTDVTSVYGYPGPLAWGVDPGDPFLDDAWARLRTVWREQRAVTAFTRFHPLLDNASLAAGLSSGTGNIAAPDGVVMLGATISVDCSLSDEEVFATYHRSLRQHLRVSRRRGMVTEEDPDWRELDTFSAIYAETMGRNRAADHYLFSSEDFAYLRDALPGHVHLLVTRLEGEVAAAGIFTEFDGIVEAHLVGSRADFDDCRRPRSFLMTRAAGPASGGISCCTSAAAGAVGRTRCSGSRASSRRDVTRSVPVDGSSIRVHTRIWSLPTPLRAPVHWMRNSSPPTGHR